MARFRYRAYDHEGNAANGEMEERSAHRVRRVLEERGLTVTEVHEAAEERALLRVSARLTPEELHLFTQQLHAITRAGLPMTPALRALAADLRSTRLKSALDALQRDLERGLSLSEALERQPKRFPPLFSNLVRAGEAAGNLPGTLQLLTAYTARQLTLRATLQAALVYPAVVFAVSIAILYLMLVKVVPTFASIFHDFGGSLPSLTLFWINVADALLNLNGVWLAADLAGAIAVILAVRWKLSRTQDGQCRADALRLRLPWYGYTYFLISTSRFARAFSLLLASRTPVLEALELAGAASGSPLLQRHVEEASVNVAGGQRIADALAATGFFSHSFCWLLGAGEDRGEVELTLESLADSAERQSQARDRTLGALIAPVLLVVLGIIVGTIIMSMYLPIFTLGDKISGT